MIWHNPTQVIQVLQELIKILNIKVNLEGITATTSEVALIVFKFTSNVNINNPKKPFLRSILNYNSDSKSEVEVQWKDYDNIGYKIG